MAGRFVVSGFFLHVGFEEPQRLVEIARGCGKDIRRAGVACLIRLIDRLANEIGDIAIALDQLIQVVVDLVDIGRVGLELGGGRYRLKAAECGAAKLDGAFCDNVVWLSISLRKLSRSSCTAMNCGPLRFQCACLVRSARSIIEASASFKSPITVDLVLEGRSFLVLWVFIFFSWTVAAMRRLWCSGEERAAAYDVPRPSKGRWKIRAALRACRDLSDSLHTL